MFRLCFVGKRRPRILDSERNHKNSHLNRILNFRENNAEVLVISKKVKFS